MRGSLPWRSSDGERNPALGERSAPIEQGACHVGACFHSGGRFEDVPAKGRSSRTNVVGRRKLRGTRAAQAECRRQLLARLGVTRRHSRLAHLSTTEADVCGLVGGRFVQRDLSMTAALGEDAKPCCGRAFTACARPKASPARRERFPGRSSTPRFARRSSRPLRRCCPCARCRRGGRRASP